MTKYNGYKGNITKICILSSNIDVEVGENIILFGVDAVHEMAEVKGSTVHVCVASVPMELAKEMVSVGRAHMFYDVFPKLEKEKEKEKKD